MGVLHLKTKFHVCINLSQIKFPCSKLLKNSSVKEMYDAQNSLSILLLFVSRALLSGRSVRRRRGEGVRREEGRVGKEISVRRLPRGGGGRRRRDRIASHACGNGVKFTATTMRLHMHSSLNVCQ